MSNFHLHKRIPGIIAIPFLVLAAAAVFVGGYIRFNRKPGSANATGVARRSVPVLPADSFSPYPLARQTDFPPFEAEGWLNDEPPSPNAHGQKLMVVDIWAGWCPACRETAPELVKIYERFKDRVQFVSLTNLSREKVEAFDKRFSIPWPSGYGATHQSLARYGAYTTDRMSATYNPGYEVSPTLYIVAPDGRVLWNDGQARPRHLKVCKDLIKDLNENLEKLLVAEAILD